MSSLSRCLLPLILAGLAGACVPAQDVDGQGLSQMQADRGVDSKPLPQLRAGIWVDPNGCDHWIIDDGVEGYLSARLDPKTGRPVCSGIAPPTVAVGNFKGGATSLIGDPI